MAYTRKRNRDVDVLAPPPTAADDDGPVSVVLPTTADIVSGEPTPTLTVSPDFSLAAPGASSSAFTEAETKALIRLRAEMDEAFTANVRKRGSRDLYAQLAERLHETGRGQVRTDAPTLCLFFCLYVCMFVCLFVLLLHSTR